MRRAEGNQDMKSREESIRAWKGVFKAWLVIAGIGFVVLCVLDLFGVNNLSLLP